MSTSEPPAGPPNPEQPPSGYTPPPPPPPSYGAPPAAQYGAPGQQYGAPGQQYGGAPGALGVPRPGELLDRFLARLIDGVIVGVVYGILAAIFGAILITNATYNLSTGEYDGGSRVLYNIVFGIISTALFLGYYAFLESSRGATLGKQLMKLRVVGPDGTSNPTMAQAVKRNIFLAFGLLAILGTIGSLLGALGQIVAVIMIAVGISGDAVRRQAWHDKFAEGTQVLKIG